MKLRVNPKFTGILSLQSIGFSIVANNPIDITPEQFYSEDVQVAVENEWLLVEDDCGVKQSQIAKTKVRNNRNNPVSTQSVSFLANEVKFLTTEQLNDSQVKEGLALGWLEIVSKKSKKPIIKVVKSEVKVITKKGKKEKEKEKQEEDEIFDPEEPKTKMQGWDGRRGKLLDKDEIKKTHFKEATSYVPKKSKDVQVGDIDFTQDEEETQTLDPSTIIKRAKAERKVGKVKKGTKVIVGIGKKKGKKPAKPNTLRPVGNRRAERKGDDLSFDGDLPNESQGVGEVDFVDIEQSAERIAKHPVLSKLKSNSKRPTLDDKIKIDL